MSTKLKEKQEQVSEIVTPGENPPVGTRYFYLKADGQFYTKNSAGVETLVQEGTFLELAGGTILGALNMAEDIPIQNVEANLKIAFTDTFGQKILRIGDGVGDGFFYDETINTAGLQIGGQDLLNVSVAGLTLGLDATAATKIGFYGTAPIVKQLAVPVTAAGVHGAMVALGLIT